MGKMTDYRVERKSGLKPKVRGFWGAYSLNSSVLLAGRSNRGAGVLSAIALCHAGLMGIISFD
jgi:hypothetical protein